MDKETDNVIFIKHVFKGQNFNTNSEIHYTEWTHISWTISQVNTLRDINCEVPFQ